MIFLLEELQEAKVLFILEAKMAISEVGVLKKYMKMLMPSLEI